MSSIAHALEQVHHRIREAACASGRDPEKILLVAVSKRKTLGDILQAYDAGQRHFGENYAQELEQKAKSLVHLGDIVWHFIGHLQTNKAKVVAQFAHVVHTVDSVPLVRELARRVTKAERPPLPVLLEVNIGGEAQKHGAQPSDLQDVLAAVQEEPALVLRGLLTMPPFGDLIAARNVFDTLVSLRALHGGPALLPELSMGMSSDLEVAIACGATMVRVGSDIFGER